MKKLKIVLILLVIIALFVGADYYLNNLGDQVSVEDLTQPSTTTTTAATDTTTTQPAVTTAFKINESVGSYKVASQVQTSQIFEKIDLSNITNIQIYLNKLESDASGAEPIYLYEIHGPKEQGSLTYLNVKLQFVAQLDSASEEINEDASFGNNSFFFNDKNYANTAFLLVQIGDNIFAFQYSKADSAAYDDVKSIIQYLMTGSPVQPASTVTSEAVITESINTAAETATDITAESITTETAAQPAETTTNP